MNELLAALILGAVQGVTEFLPISSTAHLVLVPWLFGWTNPLLNSLTFDIALHMGTLAALLIYFVREWFLLARGGITSVLSRNLRGDPWKRLAWLVVLASIPGAVAGYLLESAAENAFRSPALIAVTLIVFGAVLAWAETVGSKRINLMNMSVFEAAAMGIGQALAIVPGVSRSGGSMTLGMLAGLSRESAARFSFIMAAPIIGGAGLKKLKDVLAEGAGGDSGMLMAAGFAASAVVGLLVIHFLLRYLQRGTLYAFAWYRVALGLVVLAVVFVRG